MYVAAAGGIFEQSSCISARAVGGTRGESSCISTRKVSGKWSCISMRTVGVIPRSKRARSPVRQSTNSAIMSRGQDH